MKSQEDLERMKTAFLRYDASFREQTPPDIQLKPRNDETLMPAHKSVLVIISLLLLFCLIFLIYVFVATWQLRSLYDEQLSL